MVTATDTAENEGRNRFQTGTLHSSDLHNYSRYEGDSFGLGGGLSFGGGDGKQEIGGHKLMSLGSNTVSQNQATGAVSTEGNLGVNQSFGFGSDGDSQSSTTESGIGSRNIVIGGETGSAAAQNLYTAIRSDNAEAHSGSLTNRFDKDQVQKELDIQREVTQSFSRNIGEAKTEVNKQIDELKAKKDAGEISEAEYQRKLQNLQYLNVAISSLSSALMAPTDSALGIAATAGSPVVAYNIGQYFKQNDELNKLDGGHRPGEGSKEHIALHTLNGILTGAAGGNNAILSGLSAGGAELLAPALAQTLYNKSSKDLNAEEKATISSLTAVFGAAVGAASGDVSDAVSGSQAAQNAVGNNDFNLSHLGISPNAANNLNNQAYREANHFFVNLNSSPEEKSKLQEILEAYNANKAITAEITAALVLGANVSVNINQDKSVAIAVAFTTGMGVEGFVGASAANASRNDGFFSEVCSSVGLIGVAGACAGAHLAKKEPLVVTGKLGGGAAAFARANIGYQKTYNLQKPKGK